MERINWKDVFPVLAVIGALALGCRGDRSTFAEAKGMTLTSQWQCCDGLEQPESVLVDRKRQVLYVTNGRQYAPGTDGFISRLSLDGQLIELRWVDSLSRPTGMALRGDQLFVADVDKLRVINPETGEVTAAIGEPVANAGLNDVVIFQDSIVMVSASPVHSVFQLERDHLTHFVSGEDHFAWANGLIQHGGDLIVAGLHLAIVAPEGEVQMQVTKPLVKDFDGLVSLGSRGLILSTVENSALWQVDQQGQANKLLDDGSYFSDFDYDARSDRLYVARGHHQERRYFVEAFEITTK